MRNGQVLGISKKISIVTALFLAMGCANATDWTQYGLTLAKIRVVGDYQGTTFDNTIELWPTVALNWPAGSSCTAGYRVYIDAKNKHLVAAAYLALTTGRKIDINVDDTLPIRAGACEVSYFDLPSQ